MTVLEFIVEMVVYILVPILSLLMWRLFRRFFYPPGYRNEQTTRDDSNEVDVNNKTWSFVAMQYHAAILNRTYRVWVTDKYIYGIKVSGAVASPIDGATKEWSDPKFYVDRSLDKNIPSDLLKKDKANFQILRSDVVRIDYHKTKWGMGQVPYSGRLVLVTKSGKKIELILLGKQKADLIREKLTP